MGIQVFRVSCWACLGLAALAAPSLRAAADPGMAAFVFQEARTLCERDDGTLWGQSLCGPIMIVDPADRRVIANQADPGGVLQAGDGVWSGELPAGTMMANTRVEWSGTAWTQLIWPLPMEPVLLRVFLGHEMFHRVQPGLGLARGEAGNRHLDGFDGRYLLQLEWRALARALMADTAAARRDHVADALAFRQARRRLSPDAAADEAALEINEGLPEYTGVRTGLVHGEQRRAYAVYALARFLDAPSFVRSFAYASGPAYGLLLDDADPDWRGRLGADADLGALLATALRIDPDDGARQAARERRYDPDGALRQAEQARERERTARQETWRKSLVEGPVLVLPLSRPSFQFNPQTLAALDGVGTVYPTLRLGDAWGELVVDGGVALVHADRKRASVALLADRSATSGDGWTLTLKPGWTFARGERGGDMTVVREQDGGD